MDSRTLGITLVFGMAMLTAMALFLRPLIRAWAKRIGGETVTQDMMDELQELRQRVAELEAGGQHIQELEERLEFAERMLAQRHDTALLPPDIPIQ